MGLVLLSLIPAWLAMSFGLSARREREISRVIPRHAGFVCPTCIVPLSGRSPPGECPCCMVSYTPAACEEYWEQYALWPLLESMPIRPQGPGNAGRARRSLLIASAWRVAAGIALASLVWWEYSSIGSMIVTLPDSLVAIGALAGFALLRAGWLLIRRRGLRAGDALRCSTCGYQRVPEGINPARCPECGTDWTLAGSVARGEHVVRPWMVWAGVVLVAAGLAAFGVCLGPPIWMFISTTCL